MSQWTFVNSGNVSTDLDDGTIYTVTAVNGKGMPQLSVRSERRFGRSGSTIRAASIPERVLTLTILIQGTSVSNLETRATTLISRLAGSFGRETQREGVLQYTNDAGDYRYLRAIVTSGMQENNISRISSTSMLLPVQFFASHGNFYDPSQQSTSGAIGAAGNLSFPYSYPIDFGIGSPSISFTLTNAGSAETESLEWQVPGPSTAPQLHNSTVNRALRFDNLIVPTGLTLKVRMGWQPDGVETFQAFLDDEAGGETNVLGELTSNSRRFWLEPSTNNIFAVQSNTDATVHTIKWYNEFIGV
tara:strand:+ start:130 stop:1035 length:906 start_codon:yes stop_codon:yes gene_type:complete